MRLFILTILFSGAAFAAEQSATPAPLGSEAVLVTTDRVVVTYRDFLAELTRIPEKDQASVLTSRQRLAAIVDTIVINKTLAHEARSRGLDKPDSVRAEIENFTEKVLARHRSLDIIHSLPKVDLMPLAKEAYLVDQTRFQNPKLFETWHVLIDTKTRTKDEAKLRALEARAKLVAGASKEEIAGAYSDDGSVKGNNGNLPPTPASGFTPNFSGALERMKEGQISELVETPFGFHIIKLLKITSPTRAPFDSVKPLLLEEAKANRENNAYSAHIDAIKREKNFILNTEALDAIRTKVPQILPSGAVATPVPAK